MICDGMKKKKRLQGLQRAIVTGIKKPRSGPVPDQQGKRKARSDPGYVFIDFVLTAPPVLAAEKATRIL
jgi:hypothetical protein